MATKLSATSQYAYRGKGPLDYKSLVKNYSELLSEDRWLVDGVKSAYNGMIVAVWADEVDADKNNGIYFLLDPSVTSGRGTPNVTIEANWHKLAELDDLEKNVCVVNASTHYDFPSVGKESVLYKADTEKLLYQWNPTELAYEVVGKSEDTGDFTDIKIINGGDADDFIDAVADD